MQCTLIHMSLVGLAETTVVEPMRTLNHDIKCFAMCAGPVVQTRDSQICDDNSNSNRNTMFS